MANLIMLGAPGSGKGTQAERISQEYGWPQISTGNILRHAIEAGTKQGMKAKSFMDKGELVPDAVVDEIVKQRLGHEDCRCGFVLDGFPRDLQQAKALEEIAEIDVVFDIKVPEDVIVERLSKRRVCDCGETYHMVYKPPKVAGVCDHCKGRLYHREDDSEETIRHRLEIYHAQTEPLIDYYRVKGLLVVVDGTKDIGEIFDEIKKHI